MLFAGQGVGTVAAVPDRVADLQRALRAGDLQLLGSSGEARRGGIDLAQGATLEAQGGGDGVLRLHGMRQRGGECLDVRHRRHEGHEPVHHVDGLVDERAAAVHRLGAMPGRFRVVRILAPPGHIDARERDATEFTGSDFAARLLELLAPARLEEATERDAGFAAGGDHGVRAGDRDGDGLLHQHRHAMAGGGKDGFVMRARRRGNHQHANVRTGQRGIEIRVGLAAEFRAERRRPGGIASAHRHESDKGGIANGLGVETGNQPGSRDYNAYFLRLGHGAAPFSCGSRQHTPRLELR